jgi:ribosomal protein S18 acetylase RimI-like enzyme
VSPQAVESPLTIRDLGLRDIAEFSVLRHRIAEQNQFSLPAAGDLPADKESFAEQIARTLSDPTQKRILALRNGRLVGFVTASREGNIAQLAIGVDAACVGQGVGRQLMEAAESWARAAGLGRLELKVAPGNQRAIALYERCGFRIERRVEGASGATHDMSKILD